MLMSVLWLIIFFFVGASLGSFLNVVADRLPEGKSIISPPSCCPGCDRKLNAGDMIPVFSYLLLRGRCRSCHAVIPKRVFWMELVVGILFAFLFLHYGFCWELALVAFYSCLFAVLLVIDLEQGILPNKIIYPGCIVVLIAAALGSIFGFVPLSVDFLVFRLWIVNAVVGGAIGFGFLFIVALIFKGGMGWGDVKLAGLIGLVTGFPLVFVAMFLGVVGGGLVAGVLLLTKVKKRKETIPFGPFLSLAAIVTVLWGRDILNWYLSLAGM